MKTEWNEICGCRLKTYVADTAVVGTGCAGYGAAERLAHFGHGNIVLVTEGVNMGTSRNAGSDKQTYYKLSLASDQRDSVRDMAQTLFSGGCVDGDHALTEAALSAKCFFRLCELGVPFPQSRRGEYVGYKTDHDPVRRGSSAGPLTSREMTLALQREVARLSIPVLDKLQVIHILTGSQGVSGLLCLNKAELLKPNERFVLIKCANVVLATGGPAGIYRDSCYPAGHCGSGGLAYRAGALGKNLTEWQYGLASIHPRWNVSGSYMQVLPRFISTDMAGGDERECLQEYLKDPADMLNRVFLKGYQWPFDVNKVDGGSSLIDLIVYHETKVKHRRVFLDYRTNPLGENFSFDELNEEAKDYLQRAGALLGTPIERLERLNAPAAAFYRERGVNLAERPLEIALCAQHNNGGIDVDGWWQTRIQGLFVAGEAAGTHGVTRPGGSALNAGQVGAERAALYIARRGRRVSDLPQDWIGQEQACATLMALADNPVADSDALRCAMADVTGDMSAAGGPVRDASAILALIDTTRDRLGTLKRLPIPGPEALPDLYRYYDILHAQLVILSAMADYARSGGLSRGSALYTDPSGKQPCDELPESYRFLPDEGESRDRVQLAGLELDGAVRIQWRSVRPIPEEEDFFENVWRGYREDGNVN